MTVRSVSTKRLAARLGVANDSIRQITAGRRALAGIVGRLDSSDLQKRSKPIAMIDEFPAHVGQARVAAEPIA